jgi:hypothetical protein
MTQPIRVPARCDICGQVDADPKHHYAGQTFHHDCTPAYVIDDLTSESFYEIDTTPDGQRTMRLVNRVPLPEESWHPTARHFMAVREQAQSGVRGERLLTWIQGNEVGKPEGE